MVTGSSQLCRRSPRLLLGVAGGEFLILTSVLLFGVDIKLVGSLSLAVSPPTMLVDFTSYMMDERFAVLGRSNPPSHRHNHQSGDIIWKRKSFSA
jgi:hypothetical protein